MTLMAGPHVERSPHPVAEIFPPMSDAEHLDLVADIGEHGLHEPIWLHRDGRIIDGRNRYRACALAGVEPAFRTFDGDDSGLVAFVVSLNLKRRHLNETQRALVAAKIANLTHGQRADRAVRHANLHVSLPGLSEATGGEAVAVTQAEAAQMLNVSQRSTASAQKVINRGVPELIERVERGDLAVSTAAAIAGAPEAEQREVASLADRREQRNRAKEINDRGQRERPSGEDRGDVGLLAPGALARRRQELNKVVEKAQATFASLSDFSDEELAMFIGETPSIRSLLALLRDQYAAWFDLALADRPHVRPTAGGTA